jgi:hypothetical protein
MSIRNCLLLLFLLLLSAACGLKAVPFYHKKWGHKKIVSIGKKS